LKKIIISMFLMIALTVNVVHASDELPLEAGLLRGIKSESNRIDSRTNLVTDGDLNTQHLPYYQIATTMRWILKEPADIGKFFYKISSSSSNGYKVVFRDVNNNELYSLIAPKGQVLLDVDVKNVKYVDYELLVNDTIVYLYEIDVYASEKAPTPTPEPLGVNAFTFSSHKAHTSINFNEPFNS